MTDRQYFDIFVDRMYSGRFTDEHKNRIIQAIETDGMTLAKMRRLSVHNAAALISATLRQLSAADRKDNT